MLHGMFRLFIHICILLTLSISFVLCEIRFTKIRTDELSPLPIDSFIFSETGHLQLNVSHVSFTNPNPEIINLNLSQIAFFTTYVSSYYVANYSGICGPRPDEFATIIYTFDKFAIKSSFHLEFPILEPKAVTIYFQNCHTHQIQVSMDVVSSAYNFNPRSGDINYLSDGKNYWMYVPFICIYFLLSVIGFQIINQMKKNVLGIHYVMLVFILLKLLGFIIELVKLHRIKNSGNATSLIVVVLNVILGLFNGVHCLAFVGLVGSGWSIVKPKLQMVEKIVITVVVSLRIAFNILNLFETILWPCFELCFDFVVYARVYDMFGFLAINFLFGLTIRHILDAGNIDGKATLSLKKINQLQAIYYFVIGYTVLQGPLCSAFELIGFIGRYFWAGVVVGESTILALYVFIGYKLWPEVCNKHLVFNNDEEKAASESLKGTRRYDIMDAFLNV